MIDNRAVTIKTFKLEPWMCLEEVVLDSTENVDGDGGGGLTRLRIPGFPSKVKLEPGLLQVLPPQARPLKVEIQDSLLDTG